jgi:predicted esterase
MMQRFSIQTSVHGKYLLRLPVQSGPAPLLAGFHGYGQTADDEFSLLCAIPGSERWLCCSIEALHAMYTKDGHSGASWMTSRDREQRIEENVRYVDAVMERIRELYSVNDRRCFHGFSQGAAMACRAALLGRYPAEGLMLLGGDIPPELSVSSSRLKLVHLARGSGDRFYLPEQYKRDAARLQEGGVSFVASDFTGGHRPNAAYLTLAGEFLEACFRDAV